MSYQKEEPYITNRVPNRVCFKDFCQQCYNEGGSSYFSRTMIDELLKQKGIRLPEDGNVQQSLAVDMDLILRYTIEVMAGKIKSQSTESGKVLVTQKFVLDSIASNILPTADFQTKWDMSRYISEKK